MFSNSNELIDLVTDKIKVLAIDDDPFIGKVLKNIISDDYIFHSVLDAPSFWDDIYKFQPEIVLVDLLLKDANGIDICKKLREINDDENLYIVMLTAFDDAESIENAYKAGASDYIRKPFVPYEIKAKLKRIEQLIIYQKKIFRLFATQKILTHKLYLLTNLINKGINISTKIELIDSIAKIGKVILSNYFEVILFENGTLLSKYKNSLSNFKGIDFKRISAKLTIFNDKTINEKAIILKDNKGQIIYCLIKRIYFNNQSEGFVIVQKLEPFQQEIKDILTLYLDYVNLLGTNIVVKSVMKDEIDNERNELAKVRSIQVSLLPRLKEINNFDIASTFIPMTEVSGDFYDSIKIDDDNIMIILCDVSGHGVASSYVGSSIRGIFRAAAMEDKSLPSIIENVNVNTIRTLTSGIAYFASMIVAKVNIKNGKVNLVAAGHPPSYYYHAKEKRIEMFENTGTLIGLFESARFEERSFIMQPDDLFLIYTDGVIEADNRKSEEQFGEDRVKEYIVKNAKERSIDVVHGLLGEVYEFIEYESLQDDVTIICIKRS